MIFIALLAAVSPAAVGLAIAGRADRRLAAAAVVAAALITIGLAAVSGPLLDLLDVNAPTFLVAAAVVLGVTSLAVLVQGVGPVSDATWPTAREANGADQWRSLLVPLLIPVLITPQLAAVAIAFGADEGVALTAVAAVVALGLAWLALATAGRGPQLAWSAAARFAAALGLVAAIAMAVDGIKTV